MRNALPKRIEKSSPRLISTMSSLLSINYSNKTFSFIIETLIKAFPARNLRHILPSFADFCALLDNLIIYDTHGVIVKNLSPVILPELPVHIVSALKNIRCSLCRIVSISRNKVY